MQKVPYIVRAIIIIVLLGIAFSLWWLNKPEPEVEVIEVETTESVIEQATTTPPNKTIGTSVEGRTIEAYTFGSGGTHIRWWSTWRIRMEQCRSRRDSD
jgi:hypothetical protein